ncbi:hypothetical protein TWF102_007371 [Orbilia oligospora]|uniref:Uncharacterized protein n=1 Tax=Orbilia oligospora TaxID=2813651 RepID=A0A7C8J7R5_ORBOL|nr:hypothetical protein TWF103_003075 [Orbilia oligospora]KAF3094972.1 hypothetical protein TWF102_007371 [Orbilia oligospora]
MFFTFCCFYIGRTARPEESHVFEKDQFALFNVVARLPVFSSHTEAASIILLATRLARHFATSLPRTKLPIGRIAAARVGPSTTDPPSATGLDRTSSVKGDDFTTK